MLESNMQAILWDEYDRQVENFSKFEKSQKTVVAISSLAMERAFKVLQHQVEENLLREIIEKINDNTLDPITYFESTVDITSLPKKLLEEEKLIRKVWDACIKNTVEVISTNKQDI